MKKDYHKSDQKQEAIKRKMASYSTLAATFLAFSPVNDASAQIIVHDVDPDASFTAHDEGIFTGGNGGYIIDMDNPGNTTNLNGAEVLLEILGGTYFVPTSAPTSVNSTDLGVVIDQQVGALLDIRFLGGVSLYQYPTTGPTFSSVYAKADQLSAPMQIGPATGDVSGSNVGDTGFINAENGSTGNFVKLTYLGGSGWNGTGFLGLKFDISGETHYGWIELDVTPGSPGHLNDAGNYNFTVTRWAYEECPDTPIVAGETVNSQGTCDNDIPTLSEWGLITLAILLLSFGTLYIGRREEELIGQGTRGSNVKLGAYWQKPPLVWAIFKKTLLATGGLAAVAGVLSYLVYGTIAAVDIAGTAIAGPLFAYLMHLLWIFEGNKKDNQ